MPLNAVGWSSEEDEKLVELVQPHSFLYNVFDPSRKNILARETTWQEIAEQLSKPVEECKKRWRGLRDGYTRIKRLGTMHKTKVVIYEKLQFLDGTSLDGTEETIRLEEENTEEQPVMDESIGTEQQVITDNQEYYEITLVDGPQAPLKPYIKILPKKETSEEPPKKICRKNAGRKKAIPVPKNIPPIKILPKPIVMNGPKIVHYVEDPKVPEQRSQTIDKLIEKILKGKLMLPAYLTQDARDLIRRLMKRSETQRLGAQGAAAVRGHAFFKHTHWDDVFARRLEPPIKPRLTSDDDVSQFDTRFTLQTPIDSPDESTLSESANLMFQGFTYVAPSVMDEIHKPRVITARSPRRPRPQHHHFAVPPASSAHPLSHAQQHEDLMDVQGLPI